MALYLKYRPQQFSDVIGQEHIVKTLSRQISTNTLAHAYIFSGSRGVGKTTSARIFAKAINCQNRAPESAEPCNSCANCESITSGRSIDVIEIDAASNTGVDNVRENIIENTQFQPTITKYKVFIIDEVHMLSTSAFNALLKTLEEPPHYVVFILATTEIHKIPETILSRCQKYIFGKVSPDILKQTLQDIAGKENITLDNDVADAIVAKSDGCVRDAVSLFEQIVSLGEKHITKQNASVFLPISALTDAIAFLEFLMQNKTTECFQFLASLESQGSNIQQFFDTFLETLRAFMIFKVGGVNQNLQNEIEEKFAALSKQVQTPDILRLIDIGLRRRQSQRTCPIAILPIELLVLEYCEGEMPTLSQKAPTEIKPKETEKKKEEKVVEVQTIKEKIEPKVEAVEAKVEIEITQSPVETPSEQIVSEEKIETPQVLTESTLSLQNVKNKWNEIIKSVEAKSPSLVSILKSSKLVGVEDNNVLIGVQYKLHQDKLNQKEYKMMIESALCDCLKTHVSFAIVVEQKENTDLPNPDLDNIAAAFGGVVV